MRVRIVRSAMLVAALVGATVPARGQEGPAPVRVRTTEYRDGRWFDGARFVRRAMYAVDGRLASRRPARVDTVIDLGGRWVVPPFGEAHNHNLGYRTEADERAALRRYVDAGVLYVAIQGNLPLDDAHKARIGLGRPDAPDVALAQGSLTATGGHPIPLVAMLLGRGAYPGETPASLPDRRWFAIDSTADLDAKWPRVLALRPDFIKAFLLYSDEYARRRDDSTFVGRKGLDPALLPAIVARAHAAGLRVSVHVVNAADFRHAVTAGADMIAHVPHLWARPPADIASSDRPIADADAREAARRGTVVVTTIARDLPAGPDSLRARARALAVENLRRLRAHGVRLAIGSDDPDDSSAGEAAFLRGLGVWSDTALLRAWSMDTPRAIFPARRVGCLAAGCEASFLVLDGDPLADWANTRRIAWRVNRGVVLAP